MVKQLKTASIEHLSNDKGVISALALTNVVR